MALTKIEKLLIELMRESTNLLEKSSQSEEALKAVTQSFKEARDIFRSTNFEEAQ